MKKKALIIPGALLLVVFIAFMLFECFSFKSISSSYGADLKADTPFTMEQYYPKENWDSVIIMPPYTDPKWYHINATPGDRKALKIYNDGDCALLFIREGKLEAYAIRSREHIDFLKAEKSRYSRKDTVRIK